jgi:hypothetical protein
MLSLMTARPSAKDSVSLIKEKSADDLVFPCPLIDIKRAIRGLGPA